jgi:2-amino-4-hydroxy-6-hydroxymethyldihydropteridine diphosphokinase
VYSDRLIDIDLLLYGDKILQDERLIVPHPLMTDRKFVLEPLAEIAPDVVHPVFHKTIKELFLALS